MLESEFEESTIGYRQNFEGVGVYVFRHPHQENKWFAMLLQNAGARSVLRLENQIYSGLRKQNNCEIDMEQGVRTGLRLRLDDKVLSTMVKDSDDVSYRVCSQQKTLIKSWSNHYFGVAAKNSADDSGRMQITDLDIDSIAISSLRPFDMYDAETQQAEYNRFILRRHS